MLRQARDSTRMGNIGTLHRTLSMFQIDRPGDSMGFPNRIHVSIPSDSPTCDNLGLPTPPPGWSYRCVSAANLRNIDNTGWIPIDFTVMPRGSPLASLPIDPVNTVASSNFYVFVTDGRTWTLASLMESERHAPAAARDGGTDAARFEAGTNLSLWTSASGLVGYWSFDGTGSIANNQIAGLRDESGRGNHGTASNANATGMAFVPGRVGNAVTFDGVDDFVNVPHSASLNITSAITIEAWINSRDFANRMHDRWIVGKRTDSWALSGYIFLFGWMRDFYWTLGGIAGGVAHVGEFPLNTWHHLVGTFDGTHLRLYINGIMISAVISANPFTSNFEPVRIGGQGHHSFNGLIDEVRIHNRALSAAEIRATFNATR